MTTSASEQHKRNERAGANRFRLSKFQAAIEQEAIRLRAELRISELVELPLDLARTSLPNCEILGLRHVPGMTLKMLSYARTDGYNRFGAFARRDGDSIQIVFNDAHHPFQARVNVMEELFHLRLGHRPDLLSFVPVNGNCRTYNAKNEREAYACAIASLVPFAGLHALLAQQAHIRRIAEQYAVPVDVVQERIEATDLGDMINAQFQQFALVPAGNLIG